MAGRDEARRLLLAKAGEDEYVHLRMLRSWVERKNWLGKKNRGLAKRKNVLAAALVFYAASSQGCSGAKPGPKTFWPLRCIRASRRLDQFWKERLNDHVVRNDCLAVAE